METHTPGPWTVEKRVSCWAICDSKGQDVTYQDDKPRFYQGEPCGSTTSQGRTAAELAANARLIAAAPDLLETIKAFVMATTAIHSDITFYPAGGSTNNPDEDGVDLRDYARAIIAKADGQN